MSFNIPIQVDPGASQSKIKGVGDSLADTEKKAESLTRACTNLGRNFNGLGPSMERLARSFDVGARLGNNLANSFDGIARAIQREKTMLTSIRGDMDAYQRDVQTLDAMLKNNIITIDERNAALARSRAAAGLGNPMDAVSLPGSTKAKTPGIGDRAFQGGALALGAAGGVAFGVSRIATFGDDVTNLSNRLRQVTEPFQTTEDLMAKIGKVANDTRSDLNATGEAFVRLSKAGREMGLSQEKALKVTTNLNMLLQSSGATASEAAAGTLQLMQAIRAGALQGDEFRSVSENLGDVMDVIAVKMGVTTGALKKMGAEGKITGKMLVDALLESGDAAKKNFDASAETFGQFMTRQKNDVKLWIAENKNIHQLYDERTGLLQQLRIADLDVINSMSQQNEWIGQLTTSHDQLSAAGYAGVKAALEFTNQGFQTSLMLKQQLEHMQNLHDRVLRLSRDQRTAFSSKDLEADIDSLSGAVDDAAASYKRAASEAAAWRAEVERIAKLEPRLRNVGDGRGHKSGIFADAQTTFGDAAFGQPDPTRGKGFFNSDSEADAFNALAEGIANAAEETSAFDRNWTELSDNMERGVLQQVERLGDELADLFMTGEFGWRSMIDAMIKDMTRLAIQQAVMFGFKSAFPGLAGSAGLNFKVPGFSAGGSVDTDSRMLAMRVSPNERVIVQTPGQTMRDRETAASSAPAPQPVTVINHIDERVLLRALQSPMGATALDNVLRKNPGLLKR